MIRRQPLPEHALHARYSDSGRYVDCYVTEIPFDATQAQFVRAFYTTWLFKLERLILILVGKPSTDREALELAHGERATFAAWSVEARAPNQLLMCDFLGNTRSWLMVEPLESGTRLFFGSAVVAMRKSDGAAPTLRFSFRALLSFHKLYSRALLAAARSRLQRQLAQAG